MTDVNETVQISFVSVAVATVLVVFIINVRGCEETRLANKLAIEQEFIKAGFNQGSYGRWEKPTAPAQVEKP